MSIDIMAALAAVFIPLAGVGWNMGQPKQAMRPGAERLLTGAAVICGVLSIATAASAAVMVLGGIGLALSSMLLALTFLSRLPAQRSTAVVGAPAPDFALSDSEGTTRRLSDFAGSWVILKFYRGYWCPYCVRDLHEWEAVLDQLAARNVKLLAVSPDRIEEMRAFKNETGLKMMLLADPDNRMIRRYNLQNRNFTPKRGPFRELVIPTTLLIDGGGIVRLIDQATDFRARKPFAALLEQIDHVLSEGECEPCAAPPERRLAVLDPT